MHRPQRRPASSWPAALLPVALLVALLTAGAGATAAGDSSYQAPVTELQVVAPGH